MQVTQNSVVLPQEIDALGHMSVPYYMQRMNQANRSLLVMLGVADVDDDCLLQSTDLYSRFKREQFEGTKLQTEARLLELSQGEMRSYVEIRNSDAQELAAGFIVTTKLVERATRKHKDLTINQPPQPVEDIPGYAKPKSLSLGAMNTNVSLVALQDTLPVMQYSHSDVTHCIMIDANDVDQENWLCEDLPLMSLPFHKKQTDPDLQHGPKIFTGGDGRRVSWAVAESRTVQYAYQRLGDQLVYLSADLGLAEKTRHTRRWCFNRQSGTLQGIEDTLFVCIDLDARRAIVWPAEIRDAIAAQSQPQFA